MPKCFKTVAEIADSHLEGPLLRLLGVLLKRFGSRLDSFSGHLQTLLGRLRVCSPGFGLTWAVSVFFSRTF